MLAQPTSVCNPLIYDGYVTGTHVLSTFMCCVISVPNVRNVHHADTSNAIHMILHALFMYTSITKLKLRDLFS